MTTTETTKDALVEKPIKKIKPSEEFNQKLASSPLNMVFYTDGSAKPNPGFVGWGFHGYSYKDVTPMKGPGLSTHILSSSGYMPKSEKGKESEIYPVSYFDGFGCHGESGSNNVAELLAVNAVVQKAAEYNVDTLRVKTDSEYVRKGIEEWSNSWIRNNWIRQDGTAVPHQYTWKGLLKNLEVLKDKGTNFKITWVKGHNDNLGNDIADKLAKVGRLNSTAGQSKVEITVSDPEGYWTNNFERSPLICNKRMFFNTLLQSHAPGEYYLGEAEKDTDLIGKKSSQDTCCVVQLEKPDDVLELVRTIQTKITGDNDAIIMVRLDALFKPETYKDVMRYGEHGLARSNQYRLDLESLKNDPKTKKGEPVTKELHPPRIAIRKVESINSLKGILDGFRAGTLKNTTIVDITSSIYETSITEAVGKKPKTTVVKLKPEIGGITKSINVDFNLSTENGTKAVSVTLILGHDLPSRNALKRMEEEGTKVSLLAWLVSPDVFGYATVVQYNKDYGIWAGFHSNYVYMTK